ncbi:MAG: hypothetical protein WB681_03115 [Candidatus Cybelea sp.]
MVVRRNVLTQARQEAVAPITAELPIAVRVYPDLKGWAPDESGKVLPTPKAIVTFDCESRTDPAQALTFGSYRFAVDDAPIEEALFSASDLTAAEKAVVTRYARTHRAETDAGGNPELKSLSLADFLRRFYQIAYKGRALVVAFNFPFDASRVAYDFGNARGRYLGGFSLKLFNYRDRTGQVRAHPYRIGIAIKQIDSKRALKRFTGGKDQDEEDRIPEGSSTGQPEERYVFGGHLLDARTLAFALTDRGLSLEDACELFGVEHGKQKVKRHGIVTPKYISYNRRDVLVTCELTRKLLDEYALHPIPLQVTRAFSPASIGKAYLRAMGITPILARMPDFPKRYLGNSESAFFGGRASAHIRKVSVPVCYVDFLSQYSTVNVLMGLWRFVTARGILVVEDAREELAALLAEVTPDWVLDPGNWKRLTGYARIIPDGDIVPLRAKYGGNDWQIGVNYAHLSTDDAEDALWYSWPDLVASVLLTGKQPRITEAFKMEPIGTMVGLTPVTFRGQVPIDPRTQDFFKVVIEERMRLPKRKNMTDAERDRLKRSLKTFGSATSYGIWAQMDRQESNVKVEFQCYGIDATPYPCEVRHPESPGEFCFPPLAALITGGGHLLLALLERLVTDRGGTYAMEDTDSMAVVASELGGLVPCPGGLYRTADGREAVRALSWKQVRQIVQLFKRLNPYDRGAVEGSILKIEDDNFDPVTTEQRQLWCLAISAKRYALFLRDPNGEPALLRRGVNNGEKGEDRWSEHGLGHLMNPADPESDDRSWVPQAWLGIVRRSLNLPTTPLPFAKRVALGRTTVSSPEVMKPLKALNARKPYAQQIKPFNFILSCHVKPLGHPIEAKPDRFHLIAPYETDPRKWERLPWVEQYSEKQYRISTSALPTRTIAHVKSYGDVLYDYQFHPEAKCADASGEPCDKQTVGLLQRRHVKIEWPPRFIGKESNKLEEVEEGSVPDAGGVYTEYPDPRRERGAWDQVVAKLRAMTKSELRELEKRSGISMSTLKAWRRGRQPHPKNRKRFVLSLAL